MTASSQSVKKAKAGAAALKGAQKKLRFFSTDAGTTDHINDEGAARTQHGRVLGLIMTQAIVVCVLGGGLIFAVPLFQPTYTYYAKTPENTRQRMVGLSMPNLTNKAVLSWAETAITEIMTFGFGNFQEHLKNQRYRFTPEGWDAFARAFDMLGIGQAFSEQRLVVTTVPANTAVISRQGATSDGIYEWKIQMPINLTYATNNNVTRQAKNVVQLTLVRIPASQNPAGIGIKGWNVLR